MDELIYWIWLSLSCTPGGTSFKKLYDAFGSAESIYNADDSAIASVVTSSLSDYKKLVCKDIERARGILNFCNEKGVGILTYEDGRFPKSLRNIKAPPVLLYYRGILPNFDKEFLISVVGTRHISDYGKNNAFCISRDLARAGAVIVSGMAIGVDGVALAAALSEGGTTVAVIGSGIDVCYPMQHKHLAREIVKGGCVFTEYAPGTDPERYHFPTRNRIISGLSEATVVIEGNEKSGSAITAQHAKSQGKIVYALPGNIGNPGSEITNLLLRNGARPFLSADDIIRDFEATTSVNLNPHRLSGPIEKKLEDVLLEYKVSALASNDRIYHHSKVKNTNSAETKPKAENNEKKANAKPPTENAADESKIARIDKHALELYKKIPADPGCYVESLICDEIGLRDVMRIVLKLEMLGFVTMLPGEKVKRKN